MVDFDGENNLKKKIQKQNEIEDMLPINKYIRINIRRLPIDENLQDRNTW